MTIHKGMRVLSSMLLMGALAAPLALAQERDRDEHKDRDDRAQTPRMYDRDHKDYHTWNTQKTATTASGTSRNITGRYIANTAG